MELFKHKYVVFCDIETPLSADVIVAMDKPPVCRISAIVINNEGGTVDTFDQKIKFKQSDPEILKLIHYKEEDWVDAIGPLEAFKLFVNFISPYKCYERVSKKGHSYRVAIMAGHNINNFDVPVLFDWARALGKHYQQNTFLPIAYRPTIDTLQMVNVYQTLTSDYYSAKLSELAIRHNIELLHHDSESDVRATIEVFKVYKKLFYELNKKP